MYINLLAVAFIIIKVTVDEIRERLTILMFNALATIALILIVRSLTIKFSSCTTPIDTKLNIVKVLSIEKYANIMSIVLLLILIKKLKSNYCMNCLKIKLFMISSTKQFGVLILISR